MSERLSKAARAALEYPDQRHVRRHGPSGYENVKSFKPWLRDEFGFRCVYCLIRERWEPNGQDVFGVEHIEPRHMSPARIADYDNLLYACCQCNASRQDVPLPFDPCERPLGKHLRVRRDGVVEPLTEDGDDFIRICHLNRPWLTQYRCYFLDLLELLIDRGDADADAVLRFLLGPPDDLPGLRNRRPPGGNSRPVGIESCWFELRRRGEAPEIM